MSAERGIKMRYPGKGFDSKPYKNFLILNGYVYSWKVPQLLLISFLCIDIRT